MGCVPGTGIPQQGTVLLPELAETPGCRCPVLTPPLSPAGARWEPGQRQAEPHRHRGPDGWHGEARGPPGRLSRPMAAAGAGAFAWLSFPAMPTRRVYCSAAHRDGQLFVLGGCGGSGRALGAAEVLDLSTQRWTALPPLPTPRAGAAALAMGKQILAVGGVDASQSPLASVEVYHVDEGKWEKKAALAQPSMGIAAVQRGGRWGWVRSRRALPKLHL